MTAGQRDHLPAKGVGFLLSHFLDHWQANRRYMAPAVGRDILARANRRLTARHAAGRADSPLHFDDLVDRIEGAIGGRSAGTPFPSERCTPGRPIPDQTAGHMKRTQRYADIRDTRNAADTTHRGDQHHHAQPTKTHGGTHIAMRMAGKAEPQNG